jgi:hypothetical protein
VAGCHVAEDGFGQIRRAQPDEGRLLLPLVAGQHLGDRRAEVVVDHRRRHGAPVLEGAPVAFEEGLLLLVGEGHHER